MPVKQATAVSSAPPANDAARVAGMMASRRTLNPNQRRARNPGTMTASAPVVPAPAKPAWQQLREQGIGGQGSAAANKAALAGMGTQQPWSSGPIMNPTDMPPPGGTMAPQPMTPETVNAAQAMGRQGAPPSGFKPRQPVDINSMSTFAGPSGGQPPGAPAAGVGPGGSWTTAWGMPPGDAATTMAGFGPNVQGGSWQAEFGNLPPEIMPRLQALRGQTSAGQMPPQAGGAAPPQRSFQDFWQGGAAPRGF